jgi:hypothetical protein
MAKNQDEIEENTLPEPPTDEAAREEMRKRAQTCGLELQEVLTRNRCSIHAYLNPTEPVGIHAYLNPTEPVGNDGSRAMISASYMILPHE